MQIVTLWNRLSFLQWAAALSTLVLTLGAIWEYEAKLKPLLRLSLRWILLKSNPFERCTLRKLFWHSFAPLLVVLGIAGELIFETRAFIVDNQLTKASDAKRVQAETEATVALDKARVAEETLKGEIESRLALEKRLLAMGARANLLYGKNASDFIERLQPFAGQKAEIRVCGWFPAGPFHPMADNETQSLAMRLRALLSMFSKWSVNPITDENCGGGGIIVDVNPEAPQGTRNAARALLSALTAIPLDVVGPAVGTSYSPRKEPQPRTYTEGKEVVWAPLGTDTVVITVLPHPL